MDVSESGRGFRFTWKIEHFSFLWHREHQYLKWTFNLKNIATSWSLLFYPSTPKNCVSCILRKERGNPLNFLVDYELSFLCQDGSHLQSTKVSGADFNCNSKSILLWLHDDDIFDNKAVLLPQDTLSICCKIWPANTSILEVVGYFAETQIQVQRCTLIWNVCAFSGLRPGKKRSKFVENPVTGNPCISFAFFLDQMNNIIIEIIVLTPMLVELCKCQVFLLDVSGKKQKCGRFEMVTIGKSTDPDWKFQLSLTKRNLLENKEKYLPSDTLTIECEVSFATGIEAEPVQKLESNCQNNQNVTCKEETANISTSSKYVSESQPTLENDLQSSIKPSSLETKLVSLNLNQTNLPQTYVNSNSKSLKENNSGTSFSSKEDLQSLDNCYSTKTCHDSSLSWKDDLLALYENGTFCDAELQTASNYFPVHSLILSIKSSVFCDIFARFKREGKKASINIEDLDASTVGKMIYFLYTDTLEDVEYDSAKGLYMASNKYEILALKSISSSFLKRNMSTIHCCEILLLADKYKDKYLKLAVQDFIAEHDEVLNSDQWISLEESHPRLTIETFRFVHLKNRKN